MRQNLPKIRISLTKTDWVLESIAWLFFIFFWICVIIGYFSLPDIIPTHFNAKGEIDNYGSKLTIFLLPAFSTIIFIFLSWINKYPHIFNYPVKITEENAEAQYRLATRLIRILKLSILVSFILIFYIVIQSISGINKYSVQLVILFILFIIISPFIYYIIKMFKIQKSKPTN